MEYVRLKLQSRRPKIEFVNDLVHRKIAQEIDSMTQTKLNLSLDFDLTLWLVRLMTLNPKYDICLDYSSNRTSIDALIKDYLEMVSGNLIFYDNHFHYFVVFLLAKLEIYI